MSMIGNYLIVTKNELESLYADPSSISDFLYQEKESDVIDIDKAWHAIHFTLNGSEWAGIDPFFNVVLGGEPIGEENVGYGPARGLFPEQVSKTSEALEAIDESEFRSRFNTAGLSKNDIYPQIWDEGSEALDYIASYYLGVKETFKKATNEGKALIIFLN